MLCTPHQTSTHAGDEIKKNEIRRSGGKKRSKQVLVGKHEGERPHGRPRRH